MMIMFTMDKELLTYCKIHGKLVDSTTEIKLNLDEDCEVNVESLYLKNLSPDRSVYLWLVGKIFETSPIL